MKTVILLVILFLCIGSIGAVGLGGYNLIYGFQDGNVKLNSSSLCFGDSCGINVQINENGCYKNFTGGVLISTNCTHI